MARRKRASTRRPKAAVQEPKSAEEAIEQELSADPPEGDEDEEISTMGEEHGAASQDEHREPEPASEPETSEEADPGEGEEEELPLAAESEGGEDEIDEEPEELLQPGKSKEDIEAEKKAASEAEEREQDFEEPEGLGEQGATRFRRLVDRTKSAETRVQEVEKASKVLADVIQSFGPVEPTEIEQLARISRNLKSGTKEGIMSAIQEIESFVGPLKAQLGLASDANQVLQHHPDLKAMVDNLEMTEEEAVAAAKQRADQQWQQRQQQQTERQTQVQSVTQTLNMLDQQWQITNPAYDQKVFAGGPPDEKGRDSGQSIKDLMNKSVLFLGQQFAQGQITQDQLLQTLHQQYTGLMQQVQQQAPAVFTPTPQQRDYNGDQGNNQPMMPGRRSARPRQTEPQTMEQAIDFALNGARTG